MKAARLEGGFSVYNLQGEKVLDLQVPDARIADASGMVAIGNTLFVSTLNTLAWRGSSA